MAGVGWRELQALERGKAMNRGKETGFGSSSSWRGSRSWLWQIGLAGAVLGVALAGCATGDGSERQNPEIAALRQAVGTPGMAASGVDAWRSWGLQETDTPIDSDPALCSNLGAGFFVVTRNADLRYYVRMTFVVTNPEWKQFGLRQFVSSPSCVFQQPFFSLSDLPSDQLFLMAGKSTDGRIYTIEGTLVGGGTEFPLNPDWTGPWVQVSPTQYSPTNGHPALGSDRNRVVVTFLNDNRIHAHAQTLPYTSGPAGWGPRIDGPTLPSGVTANGVPAIVYVGGATNRFVVMVRGVSGGVPGLYWIYFDGTAFLGNWSRLSIPEVVDSDPSLEWDGHNDTITVYFKTVDNRITQTSAHRVEDLGVYPLHLVDELEDNFVILGAPRAVFGASIEPNGLRGVVARGYDIDRSTEENRDMWVLHAQDLVHQALQCDSGVKDPIWNESDVDCGGDLCAPCAEGKTCNVDPDCESRNCNSGICGPPLPANPCAGYCTNPVPISWDPLRDYQSGGLGSGTTCREVRQYFDGLWCGNFVGGKQLIINGTVMNCAGTGGNTTPPPPQNGGYCIQSTAGDYSWAAYALWDTTQGRTPL